MVQVCFSESATQYSWSGLVGRRENKDMDDESKPVKGLNKTEKY